MSQKVAYIITGETIHQRRGLISAALNRVKHLLTLADYEITIYAVVNKESWLFRLLKRRPKQEMPSQIVIDGMNINLIWMPLTVLDIFMDTRVRYKPLIRHWFFRTQCSQFKDYDLLVAHSSFAIPIAYNVKKKYNIPYCAIWHGSDMHTLPFHNKYTFNQTKEAIKRAEINFFVSKKLMETSDLICKTGNKQVLYNGVGDKFYRYDEETRKKIKIGLGINSEREVVGFVGNLIPIKNAELLPKIFHAIETQYANPLTFLIVGDGKLRKQVEIQTKSVVKDCLFLGNYPSEKMPDIMNCIDLLVLPSRNEGLPLVTLEALACGARVVGSNVGGIAEAIGEENVCELNENFINAIGSKAANMLVSDSNRQHFPLQMLWSNTAAIENQSYLDIMNNKHNKFNQ